ncbi:MAG: cold-shock protein [Pirellulales bacterium]
MPQGTIKKLVTDKGFGFISGERDDVFFHFSSLDGVTIEDLHEGQSVEYQVEQEGAGKSPRGKGPRASSVKPV